MPMAAGGNGAGAVEVVAPAKLNLSLLVGPLRADGYHEIVSLMVPLTLADTVSVERTPGQGLEVLCEVEPGEDNLAARIVRELEVRLERVLEVRITISKCVPVGGGLGGGSSDAAATLVALERLFGLDIAPRLRLEVAAAVGSDVPFFLWPGPQLAMGRGQVLKAVDLPGLHFVVAVPDLALATREVYGWHDEDTADPAAAFVPRARRLSQQIQAAQTTAAVAALVHNDLEPCVVARRPQVGVLRDRLLAEGALAAAMTGSGAAVFGLFPDAHCASRARAALAPTRAWHVTDLQPVAFLGGDTPDWRREP
ncbi:MAG TPA: 4-(cytidine 5'-diphospho)-2-C-methyl-D-erythritol kinase [Thermoleophilia bacterium]|nr:4-(cytidine 5'-diphospho)-2-C-methyl-D-erythritol kinase [Thermoleophilia bacterium]